MGDLPPDAKSDCAPVRPARNVKSPFDASALVVCVEIRVGEMLESSSRRSPPEIGEHMERRRMEIRIKDHQRDM
ncbi:MAG: hypothetical protein ACREF3_03550, partial [Acetobacteraceae bacterium]